MESETIFKLSRYLSHFTSFADKNPTSITFEEFATSIRTGIIKEKSYQDIFDKIRKETDKETRNNLKKNLPAVTISAICKDGHAKKNILQNTGFIQVDIDNVRDVQTLCERLRKDPYVFLLFISPGGNGLKLIVHIGDADHKEVFFTLTSYFKKEYQVICDEQVKDESRLCYYSYDPDIFVNEDSQLFRSNEKTTESIVKVKVDIEEIIRQIEEKQLDMTDTYENWRNIGFALSDTFGDEGENYYHIISKYNPDYNPDKCRQQYLACLNSTGTGISIRTFYKIAKDHGLLISEKKKSTNDHKSFYYPVLDKEGNIKDIKIDYPKWVDLLYSLGFRRFDLDKNFIFVRITDQIIEEVTVTLIQDAFIKYLEGLPYEVDHGITRESLISKFYRNPSHYFCENRLNLLRPRELYEFQKDSKEECFIYFRNGFVKCTATGYDLISYSDLKGLVWHDQIVDREFIMELPEQENNSDTGEFARFVFNICGQDAERYKAMWSIIGYLLHSYFFCKLKAVVLTDSKISQEPSGRTGKTLLCQALGNIKKYTEINGKDFDPANKHKYQQVNLDTQITHLNDVKKNFDIEWLFNDITEGIVSDKKNTKPFKVQSKLIVSTNQTIRVEGASAKDRAIEFELAEHYSEKWSPENEFGHWFFRDWDMEEWARFDNFFMSCICYYLKVGIAPVSQVNLNRRKLLDTTSLEFVEFMDEQYANGQIKLDVDYKKAELFNRFLEDCPDLKDHKNFKLRQFTACLRAYALYSGYFSNFDPAKHEHKSGPDRFIIFPSK
jgi:hypothetical protein